jgi:signal transduction histidine kinase
MHDDLTQRLALLAIEAGKLETESQKYDSSMHANLQEMKKKIIKLSKDIHDISRQIHPSILDDLGLVNAIKSECAAFTQREGINVEYETSNVPLSIPRNVKICIYRIIQESLRNIARHAGTDKAQVSLTCSDGNLFLTIRDNGIGFDTLHMQVRKGIGLRSIHERVRLIQGEFSVQSKPGEGTVIKVTAPFAKEQK